ncbi:hypothetical protein ABTY59_19960 [Streptomyces sp. NPDC096079]|uniref:hypothetical protein n=1 Tax=Streptomyces sp. NPDC096079 TaxID=3155820 RepID=UPI0033273DD0
MAGSKDKDKEALRAEQSAKDTLKQREQQSPGERKKGEAPEKAPVEPAVPAETPAPEPPRRYGRG